MAQRRDIDATGGRQANNNKFGFLAANEDPRYAGGLVIESSPVEEVALSPLAEMIAMVNDVKAQYNAHCADGTTAHTIADSTNTVATADATDEATAYALANALKAAYEAHRVLTAGSVHDGADATNTIGSADATTFATMCTLIEELKEEYEDHRVNVSTCHDGADVTNVVTAADYASKTCATCKIPANSLGLGVSSYVKEGAATAVNYDVGISGDLTRFVSNELDTLDKAAMHLGDAWDRYTSEAAIMLTPNARPTTAAGKILVQAHYIRLLPLTAG